MGPAGNFGRLRAAGSGSRLGAVAALNVVCAAGAAVMVAAGLRGRILKVSQHYEVLLATADELSRRAEAATRVKDESFAMLPHELGTPVDSVLGWTASSPPPG